MTHLCAGLGFFNGELVFLIQNSVIKMFKTFTGKGETGTDLFRMDFPAGEISRATWTFKFRNSMGTIKT